MTPWTVARQAPLSMGFPRQEYWSGLPFPSPGDLLNTGTEPKSPGLTSRFFTTEPPGKTRLRLTAIDFSSWHIAAIRPLLPAIGQTALLLFLEWLTHSLWKPGWAKRTLSSKYCMSMLWLLLITEVQRGKQWCTSHHCCKSLPFQLKWLPGDLKRQQRLPLPSFFFLFLYWF